MAVTAYWGLSGSLLPTELLLGLRASFRVSCYSKNSRELHHTHFTGGHREMPAGAHS